MKILLLVFAVCLSLPAWGSSPFPSPDSKWDVEIFGNTAPEDFFPTRAAASPQCTAALKQHQTHWNNAQKALDQAVADKKPAAELDALEDAAQSARQTLHDSIALCGDCAIRPIEKKQVVTPQGNQVWYAVHGSCWLPGNADTFAKRVQSLKDVKHYPIYSGGYPQIYEFVQVDPSSGDVLTPGPLPSPFLAYMAIRGPVLFGNATAFDYSLEGTLTETPGEFVFDFASTTPPRGLRPPKVVEHRASGKTNRIRLLHLRDVVGKWVLTEDGYLRFFMAADLRMNLDFAKTVARRTLLDSLVHLSQIGVSK